MSESVWAYPRPPRVEPSAEHVVVELGGQVIVETRRALRVLETSHPDVVAGVLVPASGSSVCEWKGVAHYYDLDGGGRVVPQGAWAYDDPLPGFEALVGHVSLYPGRVDRCLVDGEVVRPQEGGFYGGWITSRVVGPFKGGPGTRDW